MTALLVIFNNYFHDLATGVLVGSAAVMWALAKRAESGSDARAWDVVADIYGFVSRIGLASLVWIVVGGIPRVIFFSRYEWDPAVVNGIVPALVFKHVLFFTAVTVGIVLWMRVRRLVLRHAAEAHAAQADF